MTADAPIDIVFTDVDGTFVGDDHHALPKTAAVIQAVAKRATICLVSARSPEGLYPIQKELGFSGPLACYSGAYVLDEQGNEVLSSTIALEDAQELKAWFAQALPTVSVGTYGFHQWIVDDRTDPRIAHEEVLVQTQASVCRDLEAAFDARGVHKFLLMGEPDDIARAQQVVSERYPHLTAVQSSDTLCEVMAGDVSKARAVRVLCARYGMDSTRAVAFGDGMNDLEMLQAVERSYAMANANEEVKRAAAYVVPWSNAEGGVARMLERLVLHPQA